MGTWKNLGNFQFIENVGNCFSMINETETTWNEWVQDNSQFFFESFRTASLSSSNPIAQVMRDPQIDAWLEKVNLK